MDQWAARCSADLNCKAILYNSSDDPITLRYRLWSAGREVESYASDAAGAAAATFRSELRPDAAPGEPREFVDAFIRDQQAYVPAWDTARRQPGEPFSGIIVGIPPGDIQALDLLWLSPSPGST